MLCNVLPNTPRSSISISLLASVFLLTTGSAAISKELQADPHSLSSVLMVARGGDHIVLAPGAYGQVDIADRTWSPAIAIDGKAATFSKIDIMRSHGIDLQGGSIQSTGGRVHAIDIGFSSDVGISNASISLARAGIVVDRSQGITISGNDLHDLESDGIDIALSRNILIKNNRCSGFTPTHAVYDSNGARISDGDHPDCIQAWSRPSDLPVSDLTVEGNVADGDMQGISFFNHIRNGIDDGGFDRVVIRNNRVIVAMPDGISLISGRNSVVTGNTVSSIPGSILRKNGHRVKTAINVSGTSNEVCGNVVSDVPKSPAAVPCD